MTRQYYLREKLVHFSQNNHSTSILHDIIFQERFGQGSKCWS